MGRRLPRATPVRLPHPLTRLREGVFAFRLGDELRIKRLRRMVDGVEILSDNARYPAEALSGHQLEDFAVIVRALWSGSVL